MEKFKESVFDFARKVAKERDPNKDGGFTVFCPDLTLEAIEHFHNTMGPIGLYYAVKVKE